MFRLSQKADYGLILLSSFAKVSSTAEAKADRPEDKSNIFISVSKIAQKYKISPKFLSQIANDLKKAGILASKEGVSGGYSLAKSASKIKILDVLKVLDGELVEGKCFEDDHECTCGAGEMWNEIKKQMEETIGKKTVADLVAR